MSAPVNDVPAQPVVKMSRYPFAETGNRISNAIKAAGNTIFATIDQSAAAAAVQMRLRPTALIIFGNPKGGTPLMDAFPVFALELPRSPTYALRTTPRDMR